MTTTIRILQPSDDRGSFQSGDVDLDRFFIKSRALLRYVLDLALRMAEGLGCVGVVVDAKPNAVAFYQAYGFALLSDAFGG